MSDRPFNTRFALVVMLALAVCPGRSRADALDDLQKDLQGLTGRVMPSVVRLDIVSPPALGVNHHTSAAGVFVDAKGHFVTTVDVVRGNLSGRQFDDKALREKIVYTAMLHDGKTVRARLVALDLMSRVALMKIDDIETHPAKMADGKSLRQGQVVVGISASTFRWGAPTLGMTGPLKKAVVSPDRYLSIMLPVTNRLFAGDVGGAVVDVKGKLVGIICGVYPREDAADVLPVDMTLVIPADTLARVTCCLIENKCVDRGYLGVTLEKGRTVVEAVKPASPAHKAGLREHDQVLSVMGPFLEKPLPLEVDQGVELRHIISNCRPNVELTLVVLRDGEEKSVTVRLSPRKQK